MKTVSASLDIFVLVSLAATAESDVTRGTCSFLSPPLASKFSKQKTPRSSPCSPPSSLLSSSPSMQDARSNNNIDKNEDLVMDDDVIPSVIIPMKKTSLLSDEFSIHYRQDPRDTHADKFLQTLSLSDQLLLKNYFHDLYHARKKRDYQTSDEICAALRRQFGIRIYNDPPVWTTLKHNAPPSYQRQKQQKAENSLRELYGPQGHPYTRVGDGIDHITSPLTITEIHSLLSRKTQSHMEGRYEDAHAISFELLINGVHCNEELKQWRADGCNQWDEESKAPLVELGIPVTTYTEKSTNNIPADAKELWRELQLPHVRARVEQLIKQRSEALGRSDILLVQSIALELLKTYGVLINDAERTWTVSSRDWEQKDGNTTPVTATGSSATAGDQSTSRDNIDDLVPPLLFAGPGHLEAEPSVFRVSVHTRPVHNDKILARIEQLVEERAHKRQEGKFLEADSIRTELWRTYHVGVNDRLRQWSVGGVFDDNGNLPSR